MKVNWLIALILLLLAPSQNCIAGEVNWLGHWKGEHKRETLVREVAREFEFINSDIRVNLVFPQDVPRMGRNREKLADKIVEMIRRNNFEWDIFWYDARIDRKVAERLGDSEWQKKHLVDFAEVPGFKASHKPFIISDPNYRNDYKGIYPGTFIEGYYYMIWYNADLAKRIGLNIKQFGMTSDDLIGYVKKASEHKKKTNENYGIFYETGNRTTFETILEMLVKSEIGDINEIKKKETSHAKKRAFFKALEFMERLGQYDPLVNDWATNEWFPTRGYPLEDKCLFYLGGTWMYSHWMGIDSTKTQKMIPCELPVVKPTSHYIGGYTVAFGVFKNSPNKDSAVKLMMFLAQPKIAETWIRYTKSPTGVKGHLTSSDIAPDQFERFQAKISRKYGGRIHNAENLAFCLGPKAELQNEYIFDEVSNLLSGKTTAMRAYARIMERIQ